MNILTFDLEEWYLEKILHGGRDEKYKLLEDSLDRLLVDLKKNDAHATFFCLGKMASEYPDVIRKIADEGHDIGCHSNTHKWLTTLNEVDLKKDTHAAITALEMVWGKKVKSYRAPAFSITPNNPHVIETLGECGIELDSSIFPTTRDFGGYPSFGDDTPCRIVKGSSMLKELPITIMSFMGKKIAFSGGGYFRLLPYWLIKREMKKREYNICYFHLSDLIPEQKRLMTKEQYEDYFKEPGTLKNRLTRYVKSNIGSGDSFVKLERLMKDFKFMSVDEAEKVIDWDNTRIVKV